MTDANRSQAPASGTESTLGGPGSPLTSETLAPLTSPETTQLGFAGVFAGNLAAVRSFDRIATISQAVFVFSPHGVVGPV